MAQKADNVVKFDRSDELEIQPDRRKLSAGAAAIRDKFSPEDRKKIVDAKKLKYPDAMLRMEEQGNKVAMQDANLAIIIAGMEKSGESEVTITNMLNNMHASWPQLEKRWLKDLRKAVQYLLGAEQRANAKGEDTNVVNEDDYLDLCSYAAKKIEEDNRFNPTMFRRGNTIVSIWTDPVTMETRMLTLDLRTFTAKVNLIAPFRKSYQAGDAVGYQGVSMPLDVAIQLFVHDLDIPLLNELVSVPVFTKDGKLISAPGLHRESGYYYAKSPGVAMPRIPHRVTPADVKEAIRILVEELLGDFELDGVSRSDIVQAALGGDVDNPPPASLLNAIGLLIEQFVRPMIDGPVMPHLITKTAKGAGGGLLSNAIQYIVDGSPSSRPMPKNEEERRKAITTALKSGVRFICWDNIAGDLSSPSIASVTTEPVWTDRILNQSAEVSLPVRCSFMLVGIRPLLSDELRRRMSLIEMKPQTAKPEDRDNFRHEDLMQYVKEHRGDFIWAALVLAKNWIQRGCPAPVHAPVIGSYQAYRYVVGGIIEAAAPNWTTWQSNRAALDEIASDGEEEEIENLLSAWWQHGVSTNGDEASDLCAIAEKFKITLPIRRVPHGDEFEYSSRSLGRYLKGFVGRHFVMDDGTEVELTQSTKRGKGGYPWLLTKVEPKPKEPVDPASSSSGQCGGSQIKIKRPKPQVNALLSGEHNIETPANPFG